MSANKYSQKVRKYVIRKKGVSGNFLYILYGQSVPLSVLQTIFADVPIKNKNLTLEENIYCFLEEVGIITLKTNDRIFFKKNCFAEYEKNL